MKKKVMPLKLPNGYGSVTKLSGSRRKPYLARVTLGWTLDEQNGKAVQNRITIGTYKTKKEALQALAEYGANPYDIQNSNLTLAELYQKWTDSYFPTLSGNSSVRTITSAWKYCHTIYGMRVKDLRARHIKGVMDNGYVIPTQGSNSGKKVYASPSTKSRIKSMFNLMLDFALEYELVDKNYARTFDLSGDIVKEREDSKRGHIIFQDDEINKLWSAVGNVRFADWILIQCYMGWRPQELATLELSEVNLENWYMQAGMKTQAGKQRIVPIHSRIRPLVKQNYDRAVELGSHRLFNDSDAQKGGMLITYDKYANRFEKVIEHLQLNPEHRPHDPRMTFITRAKKAGIDDNAIKKIVGHKISDITEAAYTDRDIEWLRSDIEKIP